MAYYRICQRCGAALDPGEICEDCRNEAAAKPQKIEGNATRLQRDCKEKNRIELRANSEKLHIEAQAKLSETVEEQSIKPHRTESEQRENAKNNRSRCYQHRERQRGK